jgi:hypothetical protein
LYPANTSITSPFKSILLQVKRRIIVLEIAQRARPALPQFFAASLPSLVKWKLNVLSDFLLKIRRQFFNDLFKWFQLILHHIYLSLMDIFASITISCCDLRLMKSRQRFAFH